MEYRDGMFQLVFPSYIFKIKAAIDSSGLESSAASGYFVRRRREVGGPWKSPESGS